MISRVFKTDDRPRYSAQFPTLQTMIITLQSFKRVQKLTANAGRRRQ